MYNFLVCIQFPWTAPRIYCSLVLRLCFASYWSALSHFPLYFKCSFLNSHHVYFYHFPRRRFLSHTFLQIRKKRDLELLSSCYSFSFIPWKLICVADNLKNDNNKTTFSGFSKGMNEWNIVQFCEWTLPSAINAIPLTDDGDKEILYNDVINKL